MSGPNLYVAQVQAVALSASTTLSLVQIVTGSTRQAYIKEFGISFDGVDATKTPIRVDLIRQTTAGTSSALTLLQVDTTQPAPISTALKTFSAEPTASDILVSEYLTPAGGFDRWQYPLGEEIVMPVSTRLGLRVVVPAGTACNANAYIRFAE